MLVSLPQAEEHVYFIRSSETSLVKTSLMPRGLTPKGQMLFIADVNSPFYGYIIVESVINFFKRIPIIVGGKISESEDQFTI